MISEEGIIIKYSIKLSTMTTVLVSESNQILNTNTAILPIHKTMLPFLKKESINYTIVAVSISFVDLVYIEVPLTPQDLQAFLHAGIRIGKERASLSRSERA